MDPLFIFLDLEAAHGNNYFGDIIEIAAQVDPRVKENEVFSSLINTDESLSYFALKVSKITKEVLKGEKYFPEVFQQFIDWVAKVNSECSQENNKKYVPVLVAHGGFDNDFVMIQSNLDRHKLSLDILKKFQFADTYLLSKQLKSKNVCDLWKCQLSIEKLLEHFFPGEKFEDQHRALPDVKYMIKIFIESPLKEYFDDHIPIANFQDRKQEYEKKNTSIAERKLLNDNLPENMAKASHAMTLNRLLRNGLTYSRLISLFESSSNTYDFFDKLKDIGIERKCSKAIAAQLISMNYCCGNDVQLNKRDETVNEKESGMRMEDEEEVRGDAMNQQSENENTAAEVKEKKAPVKVLRTDSGYASWNDVTDEKYRIGFYEMFVEDFMLPPDKYEYQFGSFSLEEIEELDILIGDLFDAMFGEDECSVVEGYSEGVEVNDVSDTTLVEKGNVSGVDTGDQVVEESWDDEFDETVEFHLPSRVKDIPIGMTINNVSGREFAEKEPLFRHFEEFDVEAVPKGGLPKMNAKQRRQMKRKNIMRLKEQDKRGIDPNANSGQGRSYGKTESGEIILLV